LPGADIQDYFDCERSVPIRVFALSIPVEVENPAKNHNFAS
jgi:hypothetical protein